MKTLSVDLETYSDRELGGASGVGVHKYAESMSFDIMLIGYSIDYGKAEQIDLACGANIPDWFVAALTDPDVTKTAFNAPFERTCLSAYFGLPMPPEQWEDTLVLAAACGLPLKLSSVCEALGLPPDEAKKDGDALIRYFAKPCKPTIANGGRTRNLPCHDYERWERYKEYNLRDVEVENTIRKRLMAYKPDEVEHKIWCLDQKINDAGVHIDLQLARNAIAFSDRYSAELSAKARDISGVDNIKSNVQVKAWMEKQEGISIDSISKKAMPEVIEQLSSDKVKEFIKLRTELNKTSTAKYKKMITCACGDDHVRGLFQFYGARSGRWAGRLLQLQNLPQNHIADLDDTRALVRAGLYTELSEKHSNIATTLSELIRTAIIPERGCHFLVADFSAIEARVIAWYSNEQWRLDLFRNGGDIYCESASHIYGVPVEKNGVNGHLRQKGKIAELACGYGGSVAALRAMDVERALANEPDSELKKLVDDWRKASPNLVAWWWEIDRCAKACIRGRTTTVDKIGGIIFQFERGNMFVTLRSGRRLCYVGVGIGTNRFGGDSITFHGIEQTTHKWATIETYGPKIVENIVQATARDILRDAMLRMDEQGYDIRAHVHDEVIVNEPIGGRTVDDLIEAMRQVPDWAEGLPLNAAGFESGYYMKD